MAWAGATPTNLDVTTKGAPNHSSIASASVSPANDALIAAGMSTEGNISRTLDSYSSGFSVTAAGWTVNVSVEHGSSPGRPLTGIGTAIATSSPGSGTVTATWSGAKATSAIHVNQITSGFDTTTPIVAANNSTDIVQGTTTTPSWSMNQALASDGLAISQSAPFDDGVGGPTHTAGTNWTELADAVSGDLGSQSQEQDTDNTVSATLSAAPDRQSWVAIELNAAAVAGGRIMSSLAHYGGLAGMGGIAGKGGGLAS